MSSSLTIGIHFGRSIDPSLHGFGPGWSVAGRQ